MSTIDLFCFPFAGGSKYSYGEFNKRCPSNLNIKCFDYPGRGNRSGEPLVSDVHELVEDAFINIKPMVVNNTYAIYGHSMGALVMYLLLHKLADAGYPLPAHVFITGAHGPSAKRKEKKHLMEKKEFIGELKKYGGCPHEFLDNDVLFSFIDSVLRSDFKAVENYIYTPRPQLQVDLTVITGTEEDISKSDILLWQNESSGQVDFRIMEGRHFFIYEHADEILAIIVQKLGVTWA